MPLPAIVQPTDSFNVWFNATNNLISHVADTNVYLLVQQVASPVTSTGNVSLTGTATIVGSLSTTKLNVTSNANITGNLSIGNTVTIQGAVTISNSLSTTRNIQVTANVEAYNMIATSNVSADVLNVRLVNMTGNLALSGGSIINATGNIVTAGVLTATGNITSSGTINATGNITSISGSVNAANFYASANVHVGASGNFTGNGSAITSLNAASLVGNVNTATLPIASASVNGIVTISGTQTFAGAKQFTGNVTLQARLSVALPSTFASEISITGNGTFTQNVSASNFIGIGTQLTALNASNISSGTLSADRIAAASLAYSKLSLGNSIINSDISTGAAIAVSKLAASTISGVTLGNNLNAVTFNNSGAGGGSGTTYNGSGAVTISYNSIGAVPPNGTGASGTWGINVTGTAASISGFNNPTTAATGSTIVYRDGSGNISGVYGFYQYLNQSGGNSENPSIAQIWTQSAADNYCRKSTPAHFISQLGLLTTSNYNSYAPALNGAGASGTWSISVTGSASSATSAGSATTATTATFAQQSPASGDTRFFVNRQNTSAEGGELTLRRALDNAAVWIMDVYGAGIDPELRIFPDPGFGGSGGVRLLNATTAWQAPSDIRLKQLDEPITNAVTRLEQLRTVMGRFNTDDAWVRRPFLIAQDVEPLFEGIVHTVEEEDLADKKIMSYETMMPYVIAAIKELATELRSLRAQVTAMSASA